MIKTIRDILYIWIRSISLNLGVILALALYTWFSKISKCQFILSTHLFYIFFKDQWLKQTKNKTGLYLYCWSPDITKFLILQKKTLNKTPWLFRIRRNCEQVAGQTSGMQTAEQTELPSPVSNPKIMEHGMEDCQLSAKRISEIHKCLGKHLICRSAAGLHSNDTWNTKFKISYPLGLQKTPTEHVQRDKNPNEVSWLWW